ncbi:MAG: putative Hybrid PKS-NRPS biosynthetic cluster [Sclerophora amabilis]|nr:MAG: putative Hybrid PKS-NRPS biosynthetic cluster [Sclerophora amabilis]
MATSRRNSDPIAIIGTGCRFPGNADTPSKLWELLREPQDLLKEISDSRFSVDPFYHPNNAHHGTSNVRHSYLLEEDLRRFDAQFFGIKAIEASSIDPQQRLLLETVYEGLESAGLSIKRLQGSDTAVYVGVMSADFTDMIGRDTETFPTYFATGTARSILSNRLSYFFDWHGPSMTIDTACSSSLIAMHQAVQTLRDGDSSVAVVAGSNLILGPEQFIAESKLQMLSPTGRSRMWDADADGYARGEGVAAIVLKRLSQALADGDHVECIIRETGLNQDGKTKGITMPSATAQAALIRTTYEKAGLDLSRRSDRPQFFEAHGTGTPAGDPIEAEAISAAFFGPEANFTPSSQDDTLYVGSIKTVVGHTEGTAGLAAVIKASLALQAGVIPPNRLLDRLNPNIAPFYRNLKILPRAQEWPALARDGVRRVSVNSFGFGGANAHAILESFEPSAYTKAIGTGIAVTPFTFSAASESTLSANLRVYRDYLGENIAIDLRDLSWTLHSRRSNHPYRLALAATNAEDLIFKLDDAVENLQDKVSKAGGRTKSVSTKTRILGIFTGQGAQWARMGADLIMKVPGASDIINALDRSLLTLPPRDRPSWSLRDQILATAESSQVGTASISQPLCTAIQIMLVDLLKYAGIEFSAVVGHSSGEIAAAYAAGVLSADDAIRVAYYRGLHLKTISKSGAMMAVGTSYDDAKELCGLPNFEGRVCVAASNSSASVTLSGDTDAVEEIKQVFDEEKKFTRLLKVDQAYHSHHMQDCVESYIRSLRQCKIRALIDSKCRWISSVFMQDIAEVSDSLSDRYWGSNLTNPVRFAEALDVLLARSEAFDLALEVGPHPALKGPASQTIQETLGQSLPYTGVLSRGKSDIEAFADALGFIWSSLDESVVDFSAFIRFASGPTNKPTLLKGLPTYQWDHDRILWHESRLSRAFRTRKDMHNELLGRQFLDGAPDQLRWRNVMKPREMDWLHGHQVQGQMVFPCAGYVSSAVEAAVQFSDTQKIQSIELEDFAVGQAMVFDEEDSGVETLITLTDIDRRSESLTARFSFYSTPNSKALDMVSNASCRLRVVLGDPFAGLLPSKPEDELGLLEVEPDRFYDALGQLGFGYSGPFRALNRMKRKLGLAGGFIDNAASAGQVTTLLIHPATLDTAIQSIMLAYCYPGDSMLRSIYLPTGIDKLTIDPLQCSAFAGKKVPVPFDSVAATEGARNLQGDVNIYAPDGSRAVQLEGLQTKPLANLTEANDLNIFTELVWDVDRPHRDEVIRQSTAQELNADLLFSLERVAYFYLKSLDKMVPPKERANIEWHHKRLFAYVDHVLSKFSRDANPWARKDWMHDTKEDVINILNKYPDNIDLRLMHAVGENLPAVIRGQLTMLEPMIQDNMLNDFYVVAHGMPRYTEYLARMAGQIGHRYPHMNVLEIGAGTGGATKSFLKHLGESFSTYAFTDISSGFFEKASEVFASYSSNMTFKVLDIEKDIEQQGFADGSFDLIIASLVLHATRNLEETLRNVRRLLRPGGYLLLLEITENEQMRFGLIFGGLAGWWLGYDDGRAFSPCIGLDEWSTLLKRTGFSGIDTAIPHHDTLPVPLSIVVSQAVDDKVEFLKQPLAPSQLMTVIPELTMIGGGGVESAKLVADIHQTLTSRCGRIKKIQSLQDIRPDILPVGGTVLCLSDIDEPVFKSMNAEKLRGFQEIFKQSKNILWITRGSRSGDPFSRMVVGFGRTLVLEMLHVRLQFLDIPQNAHPDSEPIAETLLKLEITDQWEQDESSTILHSTEPEIFLKDGQYFIPRFKLNKSQNDRYNSNRRVITNDVDTQRTTVELVHREGSYSVLESRAPSSREFRELVRTVEIEVSYSINRAVEVLKGCFLFPVLGMHRRTGDLVVALAPTPASKVRVPTSYVLPGAVSGDGLGLLHSLYIELLAHSSLRDVPFDSKVVVLEPSQSLAKAFDRVANSKGINVLYLTMQSKADHPRWHYVHPTTSKREIQKVHLIGATCVVNMGTDKALSERIADCLPSHTPIKTEATLTALMGRADFQALPETYSILMDIMQGPGIRDLVSPSQDLKVTTLKDLIDNEPDRQLPAVINWRASSTVPMEVEPIASKVSFQNNRTYWLVGLTGGLGLSLGEWMVRQGAQYVVVSSRNPKVEERWLQKMKGLGATIKVTANDISNRDSVRAVYREICQEMPPIAGVAQGAMVLHDTMFLDLDMERLNKVIQPKVNGSMYLEEIFGDMDLDFFVFFSSMASVTGNPGQSAYAAANMFMSSLATQRRERGLNASAVHIGAIFGNGYVTRELTLQQQEFLRKVGNLWLSEPDFHQLFAEAIFAGRCERGKSLELSTGLKTLDSNESETITWFHNPMFQHCIKEDQNAKLVAEGSKSEAPVKAQLLEATSPAQVHVIITDAFVSKLRASLQIEGDHSIIDLSADNLGIDSLVAVDIRSWFIKELQVDIPVLKILSGATVGEILVRAQELLPEAMTPNVDPHADSNPFKAEKTGPKPAKVQKLVEEKKVQTAVKSVSPKKNQPSPPQTAPPAVESNEPAEAKFPEMATAVAVESIDRQASGLSTGSNILQDSLPSSTTEMPAPELETRVKPELDISTKSTSLSTSWSELSDFDREEDTSFSSSSSNSQVQSKSVTDVQVKKRLPLGFGQSRFWFLRHYIKDPATFNITVSIRLNGPLDENGLDRAVNIVGQRHEALRTRFVTEETTKEVVQEVLAVSCLVLEQQNISTEEEAVEEYKKVKSHKFKLEEGENMRILLLKRSSTSFQLVIGYHHINMDGVSLEVILKDLQMAYDAKFLSPRILQYPDFSERQRLEFQTGVWRTDLDFWRKEFADIPSPLPLLPVAKTVSRPPLTAYATNSAEFNVGSLLQNIQTACRKLKVTPFHFYVSVFYTLLIRFVDVQDICIGVSSANRAGNDMMQSVGLYLNLLPLRFRPDLAQTFTNVLKVVRDKSLAAFSHSRVPFDVIVNELGVPRSAAHSPLFQVLVNYRAGISERRTFCNCDSKVAEFESGQAPYDLSLDVIDNPDEDCHIILAGQSVLYNGHDVNVLKDVYLNLLTAFARNPAMRLNSPSLYAAEEVDRAIRLGRGPVYKYRWPETIPHRIDMMVNQYSNNVALKDGVGKSMTYRRMADRVNSIATALLQAQIGHGSKIGVFQEPGVDWICSLLAILRLDATYVPLDARIGIERLATITQDCRPDATLTDSSTEHEWTSLKSHGQTINVDRINATDSSPLVPNSAKADSIAVIAYTSGSTGAPKGIVMKHHTFRNNIETSTEKWYFREGSEVLLQQSSYSFDMSLSQIFLTLSNGGTLHVVPKRFRGDPTAISSIIANQGITFTETTPSEYISWLRYGDIKNLRNSSWRIAVSGGEMVTDALTGAFRHLEKPDVRLIDCYGPTEITFCSHSREISYHESASMAGFATWPNYSVCIVDAGTIKPVPVGMPGEVLIGGAGVVSGYLHSEADAQRFIRDRFAPPEFIESGWMMLHRTGDVGRLTADGSLVLGGRIAGDTLIKLRGLRIDLRDVESTIIDTAHGRIIDAAVTLRKSHTTGSEFLVAFVTLADAMDEDFLQEILHQLPLPQYMRPAAILRLEKMPLNASNKVDRFVLKSLPIPQSQQMNGDPAVEVSGTEARLKDAWEEVISPDVSSRYQIGPESDFFYVGGNSMLLVRLQASINTIFDVSIALFDLFESSTLGAMASLISDSSPAPTKESIDWEAETAVSDSLRLVPASKRFFAHPEVVILTGATGFLGRAILTELLKGESVQTIHCLAVRKDIGTLPEIFKSPKVVVHKGDLTSPHLGLSAQESARIFSEAHAVIHNGADVSFMKSYRSLKPTNLDATAELVRLSVPHQLSFHYISTASVTHLTGHADFEEASVSAFSPPTTDEGYIATKWASERHLEKVSDQCQLPIWIHRPSSITGEGVPETDLMSNLLQYSRSLKAVPDTGTWKGWLDFVSVDRVAMQIADEVYEDCPWPGGIKYLFESGDQEIPLSDLRGVLEREKGMVFEKLMMEEWVARAQAEGLHVMLAEYLRGVSNVPIVFPRLLKQGGFF